MKIYCFYIYDKTMSKEEYMRKSLSPYEKDDLHHLYAVTNSKKIAKQFMRERNMKKFILIKKEIDEELFKEFANKRRGIILDYHKYTYYPKIKNNVNDSKETVILSTYTERLQVESQADQSMMGFSEIVNFVDPFILKEEFLDSLRLLEYDTLYKIWYSTAYFDDNDFSSCIPVDEDYLTGPDLCIDELQIFILNFSKYFK